ncbi:rRNA methyltransferase 1, mitochondrial [Girardinichthys multiradiatus]|uniref:rRNA methyltransferase 1, mitochondrial n=1 Tax=Girardinichthys multiradiatus TaxID=208333 RepID=UPI001FAE47E9|nr:rRNA methyltransferase 1, mitochondrial [Girardinichthys multiradiatus]
MWLCSSTHQHRFLFVWCRQLCRLASMGSSAESSLIPEGRSQDPAVRRHHRGSNTSNAPHQPAQAEGMSNRRRSAQIKSLKNEIPPSQKRNHGREGVFKVSAELRKLCLEDFPADKERYFRPKPTEISEFVFGIAPCLLALTQGRRKAYQLLVKDGEASQRASVLRICEVAHRQGVQVSRVSKKDLNKMSSGGVHQGVCLRASPLSFLTVETEFSTSGAGIPLWLVLDRIQDPMNLGAVLRSAYFLGVDKVISSLGHSCPLSPVVSKASSGVMEVMGVYGCDSLEEMLRMKVKHGWHVVGTVGADPKESQIPVIPCSDFQVTRPTMLLMGGEGEGLSMKLLSLCQTLLTISAGRDLSPGIESLNISVAAGILLHSLLLTKSRCLSQKETEN